MNIQTITTVASGVGLPAWWSSVLGRSPIEGANLTGANVPVATHESTVYQLYSVDTQLHLRKLDSAGKLQWQTPVDELLEKSLSSPRLRATGNGVVVGYQDSTAKTAFVKSFDVDGNTLWSSDLGE